MDNIWPEIGKEVRLIPKCMSRSLISWSYGEMDIFYCVSYLLQTQQHVGQKVTEKSIFSQSQHTLKVMGKNLFQQSIITRMRTFFNIYLWHGTCVHNIAYKSVMTRKYILKNKSRDSRMNCKNKDAKKDNQPH